MPRLGLGMRLRCSALPEPVITGTAFPGETLTSTQPGQWQADGAPISGETGSTYLVRLSDIGKAIRQSRSANTLTIWKPADIAGVVRFWSSLSNVLNSVSPDVAATDGQTVRRWNGIISGTQADQATGGSQPIYRSTGQDGKPSLEFDGSDDRFSLPANTNVLQNKNQGYLIVGVRDTNSTGGDAAHVCLSYSNGTVATSARLLVASRAGGNNFFAAARREDANSSTSASSPNNNGFNVLTAHGDWSNGFVRLRVNGNVVASTALSGGAGPTSNTVSLAGAIGDSLANDGQFPGQMVAACVVNDTVTNAQLSQIERYIGLLGGIQTTPDGLTWNASSLTGPYTATTATHTTVIAPNGASITENDLATHRYRHHTRIHRTAAGRIYLAFSTGGTNEDQSGQQIGMCYSDDKGVTWSAPVQVCPSQSVFSASSVAYENGKRVAFTRGFVEHEGTLYIVSAIDQCTGDPPGSQGMIGVAMLARSIAADGTLGPLFRITSATYTPIDSKTAVDYDATLGPPLLAALQTSTWGGSAPGMTASEWSGWTTSASGQVFAEPSAAVSRDGTSNNLVRLWRAITGTTNRMYLSWSRDAGQTWSDPSLTDIPNAPSSMQMLRLSTGQIAMIGNQASGRAELFLSLFDSSGQATVHSVRSGVSSTPVYAGTYKGGGAAYPDMVQVGNYLYISYSLQKENIGFSRVLIPGLPDINND